MTHVVWYTALWYCFQEKRISMIPSSKAIINLSKMLETLPFSTPSNTMLFGPQLVPGHAATMNRIEREGKDGKERFLILKYS